MKVLFATWTWKPIGGDYTYIENLKGLYEKNGYEVIKFSTYLNDSILKEDEKYFVKAYDYKKLNASKGFLSGIHALKNSIISFEAVRNLEKLLDDHKIDFAHFHLIHHWLTPAIIHSLKKRSIPVIWSLHDYKIICPEGGLYSNGKVCEKCISGSFLNCMINRCKKKSILASTLATLDAYVYKLSGYYNYVHAYLCPSQFLLNKFLSAGFNESKMKLTNLCFDISLIDEHIRRENTLETDKSKEKFILYFGRIEEIKGIRTLIKAIDGTPIHIKLAGTGPLLEELKAYVKDRNIHNIEFLGFKQKEDLFKLTRESLFVVCPSECYDIFPFSVIEAFLLSKPVIGSNIGGIPEMVIDGQTGYLHEPGNENELREKMLWLWNNPDLADEMGLNARKKAYNTVNFERHWQILENIIKSLPLKVNNNSFPINV
jgi:glycosyltransferase involved in cell wall biosynthesis